MTAYYNEIDPFAAAWLRKLIEAGHIAPGFVDERDINDALPEDLLGYDQCHFFAGIGGWSYALRLAGWPDDVPVWTGSCPCQPFSSAGKGAGTADPRHLWPAWFRLIEQSRPPVIFGEQVAAKAALGWFDSVAADLEGSGYSVGAADLGAASVGAPHIRQRLWFLAQSERGGREGRNENRGGTGSAMPSGQAGMGDTNEQGLAGRSQRGHCSDEQSTGQTGLAVGMADGEKQPLGRPWSNLDWLPCRDGKARPTEPGLRPLAHGVPNRVGTLRGAGNAIVPQVAAQLIAAYMDSLKPETR